VNLVALALLAGSVVASPSPEPTRLVFSIQKGEAGRLVVRVENASPNAVALKAHTYLTLLNDRDEDPQRLSYWALLSVERLPAPAKPMRLGHRKTRLVQLSTGGLLWATDRLAIGGQQPLGRVVLPGDYKLQLQVVDEAGMWWRSGELPATVSAAGGLTF